MWDYTGQVMPLSFSWLDVSFQLATLAATATGGVVVVAKSVEFVATKLSNRKRAREERARLGQQAAVTIAAELAAADAHRREREATPPPGWVLNGTSHNHNTMGQFFGEKNEPGVIAIGQNVCVRCGSADGKHKIDCPVFKAFVGEPEPEPKKKAVAWLQYGTESVAFSPLRGETVAEAFRRNADELGFDSERSAVYRNRGTLLSPSASVADGAVYTASIINEQSFLEKSDIQKIRTDIIQASNAFRREAMELRRRSLKSFGKEY